MSNANEYLKNRFMDRYTKMKATESLFLDSIKVLNTINCEVNNTKVVKDFLSTVSKYDVNAEELNEVKQILDELISNKISQNEALAYLNYLYDITCFKSKHLLFTQDVFNCYF